MVLPKKGKLLLMQNIIYTEIHIAIKITNNIIIKMLKCSKLKYNKIKAQVNYQNMDFENVRNFSNLIEKIIKVLAIPAIIIGLGVLVFIGYEVMKIWKF